MPGHERQFTKAEYLSAIWAVFVVCILFFTTRVAIRLKVYKKLLADDYWAVLAFIFLFVNSILLTVAKDPTFIVQGVQFAGLRKPKDFEHETKKFDDLQWAISNIFFSGLWSVKGSFLAFYKELTEGLPAHRRAWWFIVVVTVLTYVGAIVGFALWNRVLVEGSNRADLKSQNIQYQFGADLATDVFITILPLTLALKANIDFRRKLSLIGIFSLGLIITIFAIVRFAVNAPHSSPYGPSWIFVWSQIEQGVSVLVVCLASLRTFIVSRRRQAESSRQQQSSGYQGNEGKMKKLFSGSTTIGSHVAGSARSKGTRHRSHDDMDVELLNITRDEDKATSSSAPSQDVTARESYASVHRDLESVTDVSARSHRLLFKMREPVDSALLIGFKAAEDVEPTKTPLITCWAASKTCESLHIIVVTKQSMKQVSTQQASSSICRRREKNVPWQTRVWTD